MLLFFSTVLIFILLSHRKSLPNLRLFIYTKQFQFSTLLLNYTLLSVPMIYNKSDHLSIDLFISNSYKQELF